MKSRPKKIRHQLSIANDSSDRYIGIVSAEADYRISLLINKKLELKLKSSNPVIKEINNKDIAFSRFTSVSDYNDISYDLISNNSNGEKLFNKLPALDYVLRINGIPDKEIQDRITHMIRSIGEVTAVFVLDKNRQLENSVLQIIP